ncbi:MAG: 30S ribosomal protein S6 [Ignavibacteriales bacterium]|jgi:small subunit ribosomal protein S6|nr:30S ribosomal protein S6 [Ignavibacteriales bacterium]
MKQRTYESVVLINAALEDDQIEVILNKIQDTITTHGGSIIEIDKWGRKRLAYPIKKAKSGYYAIFRFNSTPELISTLERNYRLEENIYRYLTIVLDKFALEAIAKQKESASNQAAEEVTNQSTESQNN